MSRLKSLTYIVRRNVLLLTNGIIAAVVATLFLFGDMEAGFFLGLVLFINITLGLAQDIRAWLALENLELLTAPRIIRIDNDGKKESVLAEAVRKGDTLELKTGDQVPCDGILLDTETLELNEGLITGESASLPRAAGDRILAGSIITAGTGTIRTETVFSESRIARMTEGIRDYAISQSPIQKAVGEVIRYSGYALLLMILFVIGRGILSHTPNLIVVKNIGALASMIVPQGLAFAITLLFAYGAAHLYRKNVLLQEVNATEKLGRIRNLCMDKTGTLSENKLVVEQLLLPAGTTEETAREFAGAYLANTNESSETASAIRQYLDRPFSGTVSGTVPFSSWRRFGAARFERADGEKAVVVAGAAEHFLPILSDDTDRSWLNGLIETETGHGKRVLCFARTDGDTLPEDLSKETLSLLAVFIFHHELRLGIREAIDFFQKRDVRIRIISGDGLETVRAIAQAAGVRDCDHAIVGSELEHLSPEEFAKKIETCTVFARIVPEQKERIIEALKRHGFTAMVGDGANDALAIKKADLGIAMFEGAPATRQLASVVLMNNSFTALPGGVALADSIIKNAEIFASIFFDTAVAGFLLFLLVSGAGYTFPLTPLNITVINYFAVGFPSILVSYWTIRPAEKTAAPRSTNHFLRNIFPFVIGSATLQTIALFTAFMTSPEAMRVSPSNTPVVIAAIAVGFIFFLFAPGVYRGTLLPSQKKALFGLAAFETALLFIVLQIPFFLRFFEIDPSGLQPDIIAPLLPIVAVYTIAQYLLTGFFRQNGHHRD